MGQQSYLSLYTFLMGWQVYDALWNILTQTGLLFLPLPFIAIKAFGEPFLSMGAKNSAQIALRRFLTHMPLAIAVMILAGVPYVTVQPQMIHFTPACSKTGKVATPGHTGTTYDNLMIIPKNIKVPMIPYFIMAISNGLTDQAETIVSCPDVNLRSLQNALNLTVIQSPKLKAQVLQFNEDCYLPAYSKYINGHPSSLQQTQINNVIKKYGKNDIAWMGSEVFQLVPGFYNTLHASKPVVGFPYNASNPYDQIDGQAGHQQWGRPTCKTWWEAPNTGLRDKLFNLFSKNTKATLAEAGYRAPQVVKDEAIRAVVEKSTGGSMISRGYFSEENDRSGGDNAWGDIAGRAYTDVHAIFEYPKIHVLINMLPIVQAMLLLSIYIMLPIGLALSSYSPGFLLTWGVFVFSITFCSFFWHLISWADNFLIAALYSGGDVGGWANPGKMVANMLESAVNPNKNLVDMTVSMFYIATPMIWLSFAGWAGIAMGNALNAMVESKAISSPIGQAAGARGKSAAKGGGKYVATGKTK